MLDTVGQVPETLLPEALLSPGDLLTEVRNRTGMNVCRSSLYNWRVALGMRKPPYTLAHAAAIATYGRLLGLGMTAEEAKDKVAQLLEEKGL